MIVVNFKRYVSEEGAVSLAQIAKKIWSDCMPAN